MHPARSILPALVGFALAGVAIGQPPLGDTPRKVVKTDAEWAKQLTPMQFRVTRQKDTEPAFSGKYTDTKTKGKYLCVCCGAELFASTTKFHSGTGWPSFYAPITKGSVDTAPDYSLAESRVEVTCHDCGAHLGHVFNDGPRPTGLRYCMNSAALKLEPASKAKADEAKKKVETPKAKAETPTAKPSR